MTFSVDPALKALIPPIAQEEYSQLESNLVSYGCREPLVVWQEKSLLLDGHNRLDICTRLSIPYETTLVSISSRAEAEDWIDANQLGRRNLSPDAFKLLLGRRYNRTKKRVGRPDKLDQIDPIKSESTAAKLASKHGVSEPTVKRAGAFAEEVAKTPELQEAINSGRPVLQVKREIKEKRREARREENRSIIETAPSPEAIDARFATIVIDPPWDWGDEGDVDQLGRARPDYGTMSFGELLNYPVEARADDDCHLYLWITNRSLPKGFALIERWGFRYITCLTWCKPSYGMGNYFRGQTEHVLFGVRGSQPLKRKDVGTLFHAPRGDGGHSSKPELFCDIVESCSPGPYLEMFARTNRPGWISIGAEC